MSHEYSLECILVCITFTGSLIEIQAPFECLNIHKFSCQF